MAPSTLPQLARWCVVIGVALVAGGVALLVAARVHLPLGRLPGDVVYRGRRTVIYFPWMTMLLFSVLLTLLLNLLLRR